MENLGYRQALAVPALAALARRYATATEYFAASHPSLPNYLDLASGSTWGVRSDCWLCYQSHPNLGAELSASGVPWAAYMEGLPKACWLGPYDPLSDYAGKHDPFRYFTDIRGSASLCAHIQPLTALTSVLRGPASAVPRFAWVTPNLCHDGHDCAPATAAAWLSAFVAQVTRSPAWRSGGALFVTWDEGSGGDDRGVDGAGRIVASGGGGHVLTLVAAPGLPPGLRVGQPLNHDSLLRTVSEALGVRPLGGAGARGTRDMGPFWARVAVSGGVVSGGVVSGGAQSGGAQSGGAQSGGAQSGGVVSGGAQSGGAQSGGAQSGGAVSGGVQSQSGGAQSGAPVSGRAAAGA